MLLGFKLLSCIFIWKEEPHYSQFHQGPNQEGLSKVTLEVRTFSSDTALLIVPIISRSKNGWQKYYINGHDRHPKVIVQRLLRMKCTTLPLDLSTGMLNISLSPADNLVFVLSILTTPLWYMTSNTRTSKSRMIVRSSISKTMNEHGREDTMALVWGRQA